MRLTPLLIATSAALLAAGAADLSARWADEAAIRQTVRSTSMAGRTATA